LCLPLENDDYGVQPMVDASPPKWHLAHTSWFFETFLLKPVLQDYQPFHERFEYLFNSYYNGVGQPFPRHLRGTLSRPTVAEVIAYRKHVDDQMAPLLDGALTPEQAELVTLGLHHEQQHQELLVTDIKYNLGHNPLFPSLPAPATPATGEAHDAVALSESGYQDFPGGLVSIGARGDEFCFDNELPRHQYYLEPYRLFERLVSNAEFLEFIVDRGYETASLWLSDGWQWLQSNPDTRSPLYWHNRDGEWFEYRLTSGLELLSPSAPVCHVSFYEADAFARWAGARLPLEEEWEAAAEAVDTCHGHFADSLRLHPEPATREPGLRQMFGDVWEWTQSAYSPYPGYRPPAGTIGEYNGKFMSNQRVLRGGSCATPADHMRVSYRNFFYPPDRWQFSGIRLASDAG
jgi:ergothioneine biosynthesis protein EgtB